MASHTASELRMAARVLGEAAEGSGCAPRIGPPPRAPPRRRARPPSELEPFIPDLESNPSPASRPRSLEAGRKRLAEAVRSRARVPYDAERVGEGAEVDAGRR